MKTRDEYLRELFPEDEALTYVRKTIVENGMPEISVPPELGRLLTLLGKALRAKHALEIGALGGYSGICLARGLQPGGTLTSLELNPQFAEIARNNIARAGLDVEIDMRIGPALDSLEQLHAEGRKFDIFFIDADKGNYPAYLEWAIRLANPGAIIAADNVLLQDRVLDDNNHDSSPTAVREFNRKLAADERIEPLLLPVRDGFALARVKEV
jgi:predicted O-methyltransferase YrrM